MEKPGITVEVRDCQGCSGAGIKIGPFDEELGDRIVRECRKCSGWGIKIIRRREKPAKTA